MKILKKEGLIKKIIFTLVVILLFSAVLPNTISYAVDDDGFGGKLLKPVVDLIVAIGDIIMDFIHSMVFGSGYSTIRIDLDSSILEIIVTVVIGLAVAAVVILAVTYGAAVVVPALITKIGALIGGAAAVGKITLSAAAVGTIAVAAISTGVKVGVVAGAYAHSSWFGDEAVLTLYQITPEEIFTGELELLNANFFSASSSETSEELDNFSMTVQYNTLAPDVDEEKETLNNKMRSLGYTGTDISIGDCIGEDGQDKNITKWMDENDNAYTLKCMTTVTVIDEYGSELVYDLNLRIQSDTEPVSIAKQIKGSIAKWYYTIRNLALVLMMPILIYIGIRMMLSSVAAEKSKYKNMLFDWIIAICLLFVMQYIMVFSMNIVESIINLVTEGVGAQEYAIIITDENGKIQKALEDNGLWDNELKDGDNILWSTNNIMGIIRTQTALEKSGSYTYMGYALAFIVLVWYTIFFLFTYIKRIIYLAFLTVIAPLVAMTYPIDKISDGKAQAFDMWLKEYIFNLLIQPMHLVLYTLLISMAFDLASTNIVYTLVAIGFMMPAEKLLRKFFGFEKAQTPGVLGGAAGAALMMNGLNHIFRKSPGRKGGNDYIGDGKDDKDDKVNKFTDTSGYDDALLFDGTSNPGGNGGGPVVTQNPIGNGGGPVVTQNPIGNGGGPVVAQNPRGNGGGLTRYSDWKKAKSSKLNSTVNIPRQSTSGPQTHKKTIKPPKTSIRRGLQMAGQEYTRQKIDRAMKNLASGKAIRRAGNMITGALAGAGAGLLGASFGIASGDISKVGQYGVAGAAGGYALGSRSNPSNMNTKELAEEYQKGYYGDQETYQKAQMEQATKEYIQNDKKMKELQEKLKDKSIEETRRKIEEHKKFINAGITDTDSLATMIKLVEEKGWSEEKAMTVEKLSRKVSDKPSKLVGKEKQEFEDRCDNIIKDQKIPDSDKQVAKERIKQNLNMFFDTKDNLTSVKS